MVEEEFNYRDFFVTWTGWKAEHNSDIYHGQWIAYECKKNQPPLDRLNIYSACPGVVDFFCRWYVMNTTCQKDQFGVTKKDLHSPEAAEMKDRSLDLLLERIREYRLGEEMALEEKKEEEAIHPIERSKEPIMWLDPRMGLTNRKG